MPALELGAITLGVREGVIGLLVLVVIYMAFVLLRMRRLHSQPPLVVRKPPVIKAPAPPATPPPVVAPPAAQDIPVLKDAEPALKRQESWETPSSRLADEMLTRGLELEVNQLREEVDIIRGELAALRQDLQQEVAHLRAAQTVSPIYGDAMQMAAAGYDPMMISERCGIARAEAELVVALAKSQER